MPCKTQLTLYHVYGSGEARENHLGCKLIMHDCMHGPTISTFFYIKTGSIDGETDAKIEKRNAEDVLLPKVYNYTYICMRT